MKLKNKCKVRICEKSDFDGVIKVIANYSEDLGKMAPHYLEESILGENKFGYKFFVAEDLGKIVGVMGYRPDKDEAQGIYWAVWLFVDGEYQHQGIATSLWDCIERDLKGLNARKCYLDLGNEDQVAALNFHKKNGFVIEGYLKNFWAEDDHMIILGKEISR